MRYNKRMRYARQHRRHFARWSANRGTSRGVKQAGKLFGLGLGKTYSARGNAYFHSRGY